ncbi:MAG: hypothetical protein H6587_10900 [Flavobacteriales bacterium]|nr:hypothetical protein [Flavobacteriales bacterium]MCB9365068.1 hypothetical protein [Flavobacteriales bacterium]
MVNKKNRNENTSSILNKIGKKNSFSTPENYFELLPQVIIHKKMEDKQVKNTFENLPYRILAPTIGVLIIIMTIYTLQPNSNNINYTTEQLSESIIDEELIEFNEDMIYEVYAEKEVNTFSEQTNNEEIIDYLINDNISINLIIEDYEN